MALMLSVLLMCFGSLMIAVCPTYTSIGIGAPIVLGLARMLSLRHRQLTQELAGASLAGFQISE